MATQKLQAIAGVSASEETEIRMKYPSVASTFIGKAIGSLCDCIPVKIWGVKVSYMIFALPLAPLGVLLYALLKLAGRKYILTNRSVQVWSSLLPTCLKSIDLTTIDQIDIYQDDGQQFFNAANLVLLDKKGDSILHMPGLQSADIFQAIILKARDARVETEAAMATIAARG